MQCNQILGTLSYSNAKHTIIFCWWWASPHTPVIGTLLGTLTIIHHCTAHYHLSHVCDGHTNNHTLIDGTLLLPVLTLSLVPVTLLYIYFTWHFTVCLCICEVCVTCIFVLHCCLLGVEYSYNTFHMTPIPIHWALCVGSTVGRPITLVLEASNKFPSLSRNQYQVFRSQHTSLRFCPLLKILILSLIRLMYIQSCACFHIICSF